MAKRTRQVLTFDGQLKQRRKCTSLPTTEALYLAFDSEGSSQFSVLERGSNLVKFSFTTPAPLVCSRLPAEQTYTSVQQCLTYHKALCLRREDLARRAADAANCSHLENVASEMPSDTNSKWRHHALEVARLILMTKCLQSKVARKCLVQTSPLALYERNPSDMEWGVTPKCAVDLDQSDLPTTGLNWYGQALEAVRFAIMQMKLLPKKDRMTLRNHTDSDTDS